MSTANVRWDVRWDGPTPKQYDFNQLAQMLRSSPRLVLRTGDRGEALSVVWPGAPYRPDVAYATHTVTGWVIYFTQLRLTIDGEDARALLPMSVEQTPQFQHDCEDCVFLGRSACVIAVPVSQKAQRYLRCDQYYCTTRTSLAPATLIQRFGDAGPDYASCPVVLAPGLIGANESDLPWKEILQRYQDAERRRR
jgi:hypothetical protein